ncbi:unnamed protein product [Cuscuta campestris]|uniref:Pollen Ole e 1 allergen and extensin family protein n=1 Tax=Cuscuta campestris TaxID=132261 RepID=A0A484N9T6_9ASTE|nr:unnamed protein product [Cuscuta campestris]
MAFLAFATMIVLAILEIPAAANPLLFEHSSGREELAAIGGYGEEKLSTVIIYGTVLCHPCGGGRHPHLLRLKPHPVSGAWVVVSCKTDEKEKKLLGRRRWGGIEEEKKTDENGEFLIDLPSHLHAIPDMEKACTVSVVRLPNDSACNNHPTTFTNTRPAAAAAIKLTSNKEGTRSYTTHNITLSCHALVFT